jgi:hypothetical protein
MQASLKQSISPEETRYTSCELRLHFMASISDLSNTCGERLQRVPGDKKCCLDVIPVQKPQHPVHTHGATPDPSGNISNLNRSTASGVDPVESVSICRNEEPILVALTMPKQRQRRCQSRTEPFCADAQSP